tara:strand:+ start:111 stop:431 length:321 start_codon:yes stop_codon:yes gene_type:complete
MSTAFDVITVFGVYFSKDLIEAQPELGESLAEQEGDGVFLYACSPMGNEGCVFGTFLGRLDGCDGDQLKEISTPTNQDIGKILEAQVRAGHNPPTMPKLYSMGRWG